MRGWTLHGLLLRNDVKGPSQESVVKLVSMHLPYPHLLKNTSAEELRSRSERLAASASTEASLQAELTSVRSSLRPLQLSLERAQEEKELAVKQKRWYEGACCSWRGKII